jgi:anion-transporting  ArsA/GET3 family ATPase
VTNEAPSSLSTTITGSSVIICCGPGGVGKTSVAAAIALGAAEMGRNACVVTIDPARRLADALGIESDANVAHLVDGPWSGTLSAVMLDAASTFDELVARYAKDDDQVDRIKSNRLYQNLVGSLSGTQEYMATERLFALHQSGAFDLIVVDTPPSRHAVDFLSAPRRLTGFLDNRLFRVLVSQGTGSLRAVSMASQLLLRSISRVAGSEIIDDTIAFFRAFDGMEKGFRDRAKAVEELLGTASTTYILVATPRAAALSETTWLADRLFDEHHSIDALIVNRMTPVSANPLSASIRLSPDPNSHQWNRLLENAAALGDLARAEQALLASSPICAEVGEVKHVPTLNADVHDLDSLQLLSRHLLASEVA